MAKTEKVDDAYADIFRLECSQANDGWVILEDLGTFKDVTPGGIILSNDSNTNFGLVHGGKVIDAGAWISKRSGQVMAPRGWLKPGDLVQFIPHSNYGLTGTGSRNILGVLSDDIIAMPAGRLTKKDMEDFYRLIKK